MSRIDELQRLHEAATPGAWTPSLPLDIGSGLGEADARFFAAVRNRAERLLDMAERCAKAEAELADAMAFAAMWKQRAEASEARGEA